MKITQAKEKKQEKIQKILQLDLHGTGSEYIWEKLPIFAMDIEPLVYNLPNMTEDSSYKAIGYKLNWELSYGNLEERRI